MVDLTFESVLKDSVTIQMKDIEQNFPVVLFIVLYKAVPAFRSAGEILNCEHNSNKSH